MDYSLNVSLDFSMIYLIIFCGLVSLPVIHMVTVRLYCWLEPVLRSSTARFTHSRLPRLPRLTGPQVLLACLFFLLNVGMLVPFGLRGSSRLETGSAMIATVNLMLLFLGGATNPLADYVRIPLHTYYFAHRTVGAVAIGEAFLHSGLVLRRRQSWDAMTKTGAVVAGGLLAILMFWILQIFLLPQNGDLATPTGRLRGAFRWLAKFAGKIHLLFGLGTMAGMMWHVMLRPSLTARVPVFVAGGMWLLTHLYRFGRLLLFRQAQAVVKKRWSNDDVARLRIRTTHNIRVYPGCYFYIFFQERLPFLGLLRGYPVMLCWCEPEEFTNGRATTITFLVSKHGPIRRSLELAGTGQSLRLDGPYGRELRLQSFETVILAAKGMGIVGVLPHALHLVARRQHDDNTRHRSDRLRDASEAVFGDLSQRVDLVWWLEDGDQDSWVRSQLKTLQKLDKKNLLLVWCIYPSRRAKGRRAPGFEPNQYWKIKDKFNLESFAREIRQESRYPGESILLACGDNDFMGRIRTIVVENTNSNRIIKFAEVEYQPHAMAEKERVSRTDSEDSVVEDSGRDQGTRTVKPAKIENRSRAMAGKDKLSRTDSEATVVADYGRDQGSRLRKPARECSSSEGSYEEV